jgi:NifU-like protein involved in Fe-S cluster formation
MPTYDFKVTIEGESIEEARKILASMFDILKTIRGETSTRDFIEFAQKLKAKPALVKKAKMFI